MSTWLTTVDGHELIEVGNRRWCVTCNLWQQRWGRYFPPPRSDCPRNTPYAHHVDRGVPYPVRKFTVDDKGVVVAQKE